MNQEELIKDLEKLVSYVKEIIDNKLAKGEVKSDEENYVKWELDKFKYTNNGSIETSARRKFVVKEEWSTSSETIKKIVKESKEYESSLKRLDSLYGKNDKNNENLSLLIKKITVSYLKTKDLSKVIISDFIRRFLRDLNNELLKCIADVELQGIVLESDSIQISPQVLIRRVKKEDLEKEKPIFFPDATSWSTTPSAIMKIEIMGNSPRKLREFVEKSISILRLYKVGSVNLISCKMSSDCITNLFFGSEFSSFRDIPTREICWIMSKEESHFKEFIRVMNENIPKSFFEFGEPRPDYLTIAYNRYCDSLLERSIIEKRIANVVMGLEALFSKENQELLYRLKMRISKFLSLLGYNPYKIKGKIKDAYAIRSLFAHGGILSYKDRRKYELKGVQLDQFLKEISDYLRISIVLAIMINYEKEKFVDIIDDSLIDHEKEKLLNNQISNLKKILVLDNLESTDIQK
ncbi:MAG: hypothetical protein KAK00_05330 [Nanoarchaeota archaeon]|nr:hypothetical protein [Nanoarchaeota archaeon]